MRNRVTGPGGYSVICDRCGFKFKNYQLTREWTGAMVCHGPGTNDCLEPRHPQEFIKAIQDQPKLPFTRPDSDGIDVGPTYDCSVIDEASWSSHALNTFFAASADTDNQQTYTLYKIRTFGGTITIPDGLTVDVVCTFTIGL